MDRPSTLERFLSFVDQSGDCWLWIGGKRRNGYAAFSLSGRSQDAHRVSWTLHVGPIPFGMNVLHRCDVRHCVNPAHLWLGTQGENIRDAVSKGRHYRSGATWTGADVIALRDQGLGIMQIARTLDADRNRVSRYFRGGC